MNRDHCQTCGERAWSITYAIDAENQLAGEATYNCAVYAYNCTAEIVVKTDGSVRIVKACPNWEKRTPGAPT